MNQIPIPVFIINLKHRTDRKENILKEFSGKSEFAINIIEPEKHTTGTVSLWNTIRKIIEGAISRDDDFIIICEDDHQFAATYLKENFLELVIKADENYAEILSGGVSWVSGAVWAFSNVFWMESFTGLQFTVMYKRFFHAILNASFNAGDIADGKISSISKHKYLMYPFISTQKEFGYSDLTLKNNVEGNVEELFKKSAANIQMLKDVAFFYNKQTDELKRRTEQFDYNNLYISTYIINTSVQVEQMEHLKKQFHGKTEFDIINIEASKNEQNEVDLWLSIRDIVNLAVANDDDIIIICENNLEFTEYYSKDVFLKSIIEAHLLGADILLGGVRGFGNAWRISENKFWLNYFIGTHLMVIYNKLFQKILSEPFDEKVKANELLSELAANKITLFPFISVERADDQLSKTERHTDNPFESTSRRLENINNIAVRYSIAANKENLPLNT